MSSTTESTLMKIARVFDAARVPYAAIGGVAMQVHGPAFQPPLQIDIVVATCAHIPTAALEQSGLRRGEPREGDEHWRGRDGALVRFTDDPELARGIERAIICQLGSLPLWALSAPDLLQAALRTAVDRGKRRSERLRGLADAQILLESDPSLRDELTPTQRALVDRPLD